ncbi:arylsulfatase [Prevotella sp. S7 MS 2]|uniref:sulfatase family protein n=1 Tax=Prevotella sp. S7 MS 2 TaxID=1287488 RepID=UPI000513D1E4|nr:arylsulfatase [Prevotella sp. S7 MS 2]KGI60610.1 arylsulfatase [Prevotella sp. S7 MS 2]
MNRTYLSCALLLASSAQVANAANNRGKKTVDPQRPNVILIVADDLGYGDLECYGAKNVKTPNVNRLAGCGIRFTDGHAIASTSTPSRYSLLTGEYAWRRPDTDIAAGNAGMIINPSQFTLADMFKSRGYSTAAIGKWHLGLGDQAGTQDWNAPLPQSLGDLGFDYHYIMAATADRVPCVFIEDGKVVNHDPSAPIFVSYKENFPGEPTGKDNPELLYNLKSSMGHDMSIVNGIGRIGYMKGGGKALWKDENIADSITSHAINFIQNHQKEPFFMYFATNDVHVPRFPNARFRGKSGMGLRGDAIVEFDWSVGQIMQTLDKLGLTDNTIVILTSDNGPILDDGYVDQAKELLNGHRPAGPWRGNKYSTFEGGTAVPFIVSWQGKIKGNQTSTALLSHIDLMGSLASLVNATLPQGSAPDSHNYMSTFLGDDTVGRPWVVEQASNHALSIRTHNWKYIEASDGQPIIKWAGDAESGYLATPQLYNIHSDVSEQQNLANKNPETLFDMQTILRKERNKAYQGVALPKQVQ